MTPRTAFLHLHRWVGLGLASFLFMSGLTGAIISWDHELDGWLNPELVTATAQGTPKTPLELVAIAEAHDPQIWATYFSLQIEEGHAYEIYVFPEVDPATGEIYDLAYNQIFMDPVSGEILGKRLWGEPALTRANFMPFLYRLHYSLHLDHRLLRRLLSDATSQQTPRSAPQPIGRAGACPRLVGALETRLGHQMARQSLSHQF